MFSVPHSSDKNKGPVADRTSGDKAVRAAAGKKAPPTPLQRIEARLREVAHLTRVADTARRAATNGAGASAQDQAENARMLKQEHCFDL